MSDNIAKSYELGGLIVSRLLYCTTAPDVEKVFSDSGIEAPEQKTVFLRNCMQVEESFDLPTKEELTLQDEYECELAIFLEGSWRLLTV